MKAISLYISYLVGTLSLLTLLIASGCDDLIRTETVAIDTSDTEKPLIRTGVVHNYQLGVQSGTSLEIENFAVDKGAKISFFTTGIDTLGLKSITTTVLSGGVISHSDFGPEVTTTEYIKEGPNSEGTGINMLSQSGQYIFDEDSDQMQIKARAEDFAGNISETPILILQAKEPVNIASFRADKTMLRPSETATLSWEIRGDPPFKIKMKEYYLDADGETSNNQSRELFDRSTDELVGNTSSILGQIIPEDGIMYVLTVENDVSREAQMVRIFRRPPPPRPEITTFEANPSTVTVGGSSILHWSVNNANEISIEPGDFSSTNNSGTYPVELDDIDKIYTITATGEGGVSRRTERITVTTPPSESQISSGCCNVGTPEGYLIYARDWNTTQCGLVDRPTPNWCRYRKYSDSPSGTQMTICDGQRIPSGWTEIGTVRTIACTVMGSSLAKRIKKD